MVINQVLSYNRVRTHHLTEASVIVLMVCDPTVIPK